MRHILRFKLVYYMTKVIVFIGGILASIHSHADVTPISTKIFNELQSQNARNNHVIYFKTADNLELGKVEFNKENKYFGPPNTGSTLSSQMGLSPGWASIAPKRVSGVDPSSGITIYDPNKNKKKKKK